MSDNDLEAVFINNENSNEKNSDDNFEDREDLSNNVPPNSNIYNENKLNIPKVSELGSSIIKDHLEFEPLKISLYELIMRQLIDDGLTEVAQLLHIKTKTYVPIHLQRNSLYNLYKTVTYLPMDLRLGSNENNENDDLLELKSTNYVRRIESILPHLEGLTRQWIPVKPKSRFLYFYKKKTNFKNAILINNSNKEYLIDKANKLKINDGTDNPKEFYFLENLSKIKMTDFWNKIPNISVNFRGNSVLSNHRPYCRALAVNPNGGFIATGGADGIVKIVPVPAQGISGCNSTVFGIGTNSSLSSQQKTFTESKGIITALGYRVRKDVLISGDTDSTIIIYDVKGITGGNIGDGDENVTNNMKSGSSEMGYFVPRTSKKPIQFIKESSPINCIRIHPLDEHFYIGAQDPILRLYDINTNDCFTSSHPSHQHCSSIKNIEISQDGSIICTCSDDGSIKLWDSVNLACINTLYGAHNGQPIHSLNLSLSQRYLLSSGGDGMARLWDLRQGRELVKYSTGLRSSCHSKASFLLDERYIILTSIDGSNVSYSVLNNSGLSTVENNNCEGIKNNDLDISTGTVKNDLINIDGNKDLNSLKNVGLRINNKTRLIESIIPNEKKNATILDHQLKSNPLGDLLIYNTITGSLVGTVEGLHDAPVMNFELLYNTNVFSGISNNNNLPSLLTDCSIVTVSDDGKCRILDFNYANVI